MKKIYSAFALFMLNATLVRGQEVLYSQDFGHGLNGCTVVDNISNSRAWADVYNPFYIPFVPYFDNYFYGNYDFYSPSAANGYAMIISEGDSMPINTDLILPAINCTGKSYVELDFFQFYFYIEQDTQVPSYAYILISTDSINWVNFMTMEEYTTGANPQMMQLNISSYAANQPRLYIKFNFQSVNNFFWAIDDIYVLSEPGNYVTVDTVQVPDYAALDTPFPITARIFNNGPQSHVLDSLQLSYSINNGAPVIQTFNQLNLVSGDSMLLQFTTPAFFDSVRANKIAIVALQPNGVNSVNTSIDSLTKTVVSLSQVPPKKVLIEEITDAFCGWCPGGLTALEQIMATADSAFAIPVSLHALLGPDAMTTVDDTIIANAFAVDEPSACISRNWILNNWNEVVAITGNSLGPGYTNAWQGPAEAYEQVISPASIAANNSFDTVSRELTVTVQSTFYGPASGDFRMNCYIVEDSVVGSGYGYDQYNYYCFGPSTGNPWFGLGDTANDNSEAPIHGYVHHFVERLLMNGTWGDKSTTGNIPPITADGATYQQTYTAVLPVEWREKFITLVPFVSSYDSDYTSEHNVILNAMSMPLNFSKIGTGIAQTEEPSLGINLYPNPAADVVTVDYTLNTLMEPGFEIYNSTGQLVLTQSGINRLAGSHSTKINIAQLPDGFYLMRVMGECGLAQTLKFVISR